MLDRGLSVSLQCSPFRAGEDYTQDLHGSIMVMPCAFQELFAHVENEVIICYWYSAKLTSINLGVSHSAEAFPDCTAIS